MDTRPEIYNFITNNFLGAKENNLSDDESLLEKGVIDSTGVMELILFLEETFKVSIEDDEIVPDNLDTINRISQFVNSKLAKSAH